MLTSTGAGYPPPPFVIPHTRCVLPFTSAQRQYLLPPTSRKSNSKSTFPTPPYVDHLFERTAVKVTLISGVPCVGLSLRLVVLMLAVGATWPTSSCPPRPSHPSALHSGCGKLRTGLKRTKDGFVDMHAVEYDNCPVIPPHSSPSW